MTPKAMTGAEANRSHPAVRRPRRTAAALLALVFLLLTAIAAVALWLRHEEQLGSAQRRAESLALVLSEDLALHVDAVEAALSRLAEHSRFVGGPGAFYDQWLPVLGAALAGLTGVDALSVTDEKGVVTYSTRTETMRQSHADTPIYDALKANPMSDALVAGRPFRSRFDTTILVPVGRVLRTPDGAFQGMLLATLAPARIEAFYRSFDVGENGLVWILHADGDALFREPPFETSTEPPKPAIPLADAESGSVSGPLTPGGPAYLTAWRLGAETPLAAAVSLSADDLRTAWRKDAEAVLALLAAAGLVLVIAGIAIDRAIRRAVSDSPRLP